MSSASAYLPENCNRGRLAALVNMLPATPMLMVHLRTTRCHCICCGWDSPLCSWRSPRFLAWSVHYTLACAYACTTPNTCVFHLNAAHAYHAYENVSKPTNPKSCRSPSSPLFLWLQFTINYSCAFGQRVAMTGSSPLLGCWDPLKAVPLEWHANHNWKAQLQLQPSGDRWVAAQQK